MKSRVFAGILFVFWLFSLSGKTYAMEVSATFVSVSEFKKLLASIEQQPLGVLIRYRILGQLWYPNYLRVVRLEHGKSVLFHDEVKRKLISLPDASDVIQFELDGKFLHFEPNCHYQISDDASNRDH